MPELDRFKQAQAAAFEGFEDARREMRAGRKTSHWIWYVFPQLARPGTSPMSQTYAITDRAEAIAYLDDPLLRARLTELTALVADHLARGDDLVRIMGGTTDALKIVSCLTLFEAAAQAIADKSAKPAPEVAEFLRCSGAVLAAAAAQGFPRCRLTLERLGSGRGT